MKSLLYQLETNNSAEKESQLVSIGIATVLKLGLHFAFNQI